MVLTNQASPDTSVDLIQEGASFTLSILATGEYSAALSLLGQTHTELGTIEVSGSQITITPTTPPGPSTSGTWSLTGGIVYIDGTTEFDFNLDGTDEPADIHIELYAVEL
jgi:hypothetical protein